MEQFDLDAFRQYEAWPNERIAVDDPKIAIGDDLHAKKSIDEAIEEVRRRMKRKK